MPAERLQAVTRKLAEAFDLSVMIVASPSDAAAADDFVAALGKGRGASAAGLALGAAAAAIARADAFIGLDSGPAHIAGAVGTPAAVIFPHPADGAPSHVGSPERFGPYGDPERILIVQPKTAIPPCRDGCEMHYPHCILQLDEETLVKALRGFLARFVKRRQARSPQPGSARQR